MKSNKQYRIGYLVRRISGDGLMKQLTTNHYCCQGTTLDKDVFNSQEEAFQNIVAHDVDASGIVIIPTVVVDYTFEPEAEKITQ